MKESETIKIKAVLRAHSNIESNFKVGVKMNGGRVKSISFYK